MKYMYMGKIVSVNLKTKDIHMYVLKKILVCAEKNSSQKRIFEPQKNTYLI